MSARAPDANLIPITTRITAAIATADDLQRGLRAKPRDENEAGRQRPGYCTNGVDCIDECRLRLRGLPATGGGRERERKGGAHECRSRHDQGGCDDCALTDQLIEQAWRSGQLLRHDARNFSTGQRVRDARGDCRTGQRQRQPRRRPLRLADDPRSDSGAHRDTDNYCRQRCRKRVDRRPEHQREDPRPCDFMNERGKSAQSQDGAWQPRMRQTGCHRTVLLRRAPEVPPFWGEG